jgi:hypothetical protein
MPSVGNGLRAIAKSPYGRFFLPVDPVTGRWDAALLERHASIYFRRCALWELGLLALALNPVVNMPDWLQVPLGLLGVVWVWVALSAAETLSKQKKSLLRALFAIKD